MLINRRYVFVCMMFAAGGCLAAFLPQAIGQDDFTLARIIPNDVFMFENCRKNPERQFLDDYWNGLFESLKQTGIDNDLVELFGAMLGHDSEHAEEVERLKTKFTKLVEEVDWRQLEGIENVFAQRMMSIEQPREGRPTIVSASIVWVVRSTRDATKENYESLVAILEAVVEEANRIHDEPSLVVKTGSRMGAQLATLNLLGSLPQMPSLPLSVAMRDDLLMIAFREDLRDDVLALMEGSGSATALADDGRFKAAFDQLPPAEDVMTFFDMQALVKPVRHSVDIVFDAVVHPSDAYRNSGINAEASKINEQAMAAYHSRDYAKALSLVKEAHAIAPTDTILLYNLACFNALVGNQDEALDWLEKAVEGGFYAPYKIRTDDDLKSLRNKPRYKQALAAAAELADDCGAEDMALNFTNRGDVRRLRMQVQQASEKKDHDQALELIEQAYALAPQDSQVLYDLARLHMLKGHRENGLDFLHRAVDAGFYCPNQVSNDPVWTVVRDNSLYQQTIAKAKEMAGDVAMRNRLAKSTLIKQLIDRNTDAAATLDYSACIESTDGHAVNTESVTVLVPDAVNRPIYPVFSQQQPVTEFARFLPKETATFSISGGVDPLELYQFIEDTLRGGGQLGEELITKWEQVQKNLGLDIKQDVFGLIEGETIKVTLRDRGGSVFMIKVSDEAKAHEKIDETMTALPQMLTKAISKQPALAALATLAFRCSPLDHESLEGFQNIYVAMSPKPVGVWGTADGFLMFASSADAVAQCLATSHNQHPNIRQNPAAMSELITPVGQFVSVSLTDHRSSSKDMATAMSAAAMMGGMVAASIPKPELRPVVNKLTSMIGKLAPVARQADFYNSVASTTTFDGKMWRTRCVTHYKSPSERSSHEAHHEATAKE